MPQIRVKIDKQGRIVIPSEIRKLLRLDPNTELILNIRNGTIVLEPIRGDFDKIIDKWYDEITRMKIRARGLELKASRWVSEEYVRRKLGLD